MAEENKAPKVINKSGTLKMTDETAAKKESRDISGKKMDRRNRRDRVKADVAPKEFDEIKQYSAWNVAQSNPCFEIWLYYHLMETPPEDFAPKKERFKTYFDKVLPGGFDYDRHPKYLAEAINNAKANFKRDKDKKLALFSTEMYLLGTEILGFVKRDLDKLKNKLA